MIDLPLPVTAPRHVGTKLAGYMVAQVGMIAAQRTSGAGAASEGQSGAAQGVAVHSERRIAQAALVLAATGFDGIASHALPIAYKALGSMPFLARLARVETRKAAHRGLRSRDRTHYVGIIALKV